MHFHDGSFTCGRAGGLSSVPRGLRRAACGMATDAQVGDKGGHHPKSRCVLWSSIRTTQPHSCTSTGHTDRCGQTTTRTPGTVDHWGPSQKLAATGFKRKQIPRWPDVFNVCQKEICISIEGLGVLIMGTQKINQT